MVDQHEFEMGVVKVIGTIPVCGRLERLFCHTCVQGNLLKAFIEFGQRESHLIPAILAELAAYEGAALHM